MTAEKIYICRSTLRIAVIEENSEWFTSRYYLTVSKGCLWTNPIETKIEFVTELQACIDAPLQFLVSCGLGCEWEYVVDFADALELLTDEFERRWIKGGAE